MSEIKKEYTIYPDMMESEDYLKVLLCDQVIFINNGWWLTEKGQWPKDHVTLHVNCNDIFAWGCADTEDILHGELEDLYNMHVKDPIWGAAAWCIKRRKQMPQAPVAKKMKKAGYNLKELIK